MLAAWRACLTLPYNILLMLGLVNTWRVVGLLLDSNRYALHFTVILLVYKGIPFRTEYDYVRALRSIIVALNRLQQLVYC